MKTVKLLVIVLSVCILASCGKKPDKNLPVKDTSPSMAQAPKSSDMKEIAKANNEKIASDKEEEQQEGKFEKPVFKLKNWDKDVKKEEVENDSSNITVEKIGQDEKENNDKEVSAPSDSLAAKLASKNEKILWTPKWHFEGVGGIRLPGICISPDSSVFAIIETTGTAKGPNGSRIVLVNAYNWQVLKIHELQENKITQICFLPDGKGMALWSEKQSMIKKPYELIIVSTEKGDIQSASRDIKSDITDLAAVQGYVIAKTFKENDICCFDSSDISKSPKKIKSENLNGVFAISPDKGRFALAGEKFLEIYESAGLELLKKIKFDENFIPDNAIFAGRNDLLVVSGYNKPGFIFKDDQKKTFCENTGRSIAFNSEEKLLVFEKYLNNEICLIEVPDLNEYGKFVPAGINPKTQGAAIFMTYLKHLGKYAVIDSYGNLCLYSKYQKSKKWSKQIIFGTKK